MAGHNSYLPTDSELRWQVDILRTCLREAMYTVRCVARGEKVEKRELLARFEKVCAESKEVAGERRKSARVGS